MTVFSANLAISKLKDGNERFVKMELTNTNNNLKIREQLVSKQTPFVAIISCSDSRIPVEMVFDQNIGDVFVVRNAGNIINDDVVGSIEYAVEYLNVKLVVVMGHQNCGAVITAVENTKTSKYLASVTDYIQQSVEHAKGEPGDFLENVAKHNARQVVKDLSEIDSAIRKHLKQGDIDIVPAYYSLETGRVEFLN